MGYKYRKTFCFEGKRYDVKANTLEDLYTKIAKKNGTCRSSCIWSPMT